MMIIQKMLFEKFLIVSIIITCFFMFFSQIFFLDSLYSSCLKILLILIMILFIGVIIVKKHKYSKIIFGLFLSIISILMIKDVFLMPNIDFEILKPWLIIVGFLMLLFCLDYLKIDNKIAEILFLFSLISCFILFLGTFMNINYEEYTGRLKFGFTNTNQTALYVFIIFIYSIIGKIYYEQRKIFKILFFISQIIYIYILFLTQSRSVLLCAIILFLFQNRVVLNKKILKVMAILFSLIPIILPFLYITLWLFVPNKSLQFLGKPFFSYREIIWIDTIEFLVQNPGATHYADFNNVGFSGKGAHNIYMGLFWEYGVIIGIVFILIILYFLWNLSLKIVNTISFNVFIGIGMIFVQQAFEDSLFKNPWIYTMVLILILFNEVKFRKKIFKE